MLLIPDASASPPPSRSSQDIKERKTHIPVIDRTPLEPPPIVIGVVGPPKVGKSTLVQCLIKNFTRKTLTNIQGPVTIVSGEGRAAAAGRLRHCCGGGGAILHWMPNICFDVFMNRDSLTGSGYSSVMQMAGYEHCFKSGVQVLLPCL